MTQVVLARLLGLDGYGEYASLATLAMVAAAVADLGLSGLAARDVVAGEARIQDLVRARLVPGLLAGLLAAIACSHSAPLGLLLLAAILTGWVEFLGIGVRSLGRRDIEAALLILMRLSLLIAVALGFAVDANLVQVAWLHVASALPVALIAAETVRSFVKPGDGTPQDATGLLRRAWPLALHSAFFLLGMRVELLITRALAGGAAAGAYAAALRFVEAANAAPNAISAGAMPALTRDAATGGTAARDRTLRTVAAMAIPAALILALGAPALSAGIFGKAFQVSAAPLGLMAFALIPLFLSNVLLHVIVARGHFSTLPRLSGTRVALGSLFALVLVPVWGASGAAVAFLAAESTLAFLAGAAGRRPGIAR